MVLSVCGEIPAKVVATIERGRRLTVRIDVEPAPTGRAFWVIVGLVATGVLAAFSYGFGKQRGHSQRPDVKELDQVRQQAADARHQMAKLERRLAAAR